MTVNTTYESSGNPELARLKPIDGLRALSVLWMICFHSIWFLGYFLPASAFKRLVHQPAIAFFAQGHMGVDLFFVISGFLIGSMLFRELQTTGNISLVRFYTRRAFRILPAYFVAMVICALTLRLNIENIWANILMITNFLPFNHQFMAWSWSLAIEEQFYFFFPLFLILISRFYKRALSSPLLWIMLLTLGFLVPLWITLSSKIFTQLPAFHPTLGAESFSRYFDTIYDKPYCRAVGILAGIFVAWILECQHLATLSKQRFLGRTGLVLGTAICIVIFSLGIFGHSLLTEGFMTALSLATYRGFFALVVAAVILFSVNKRNTQNPLVRCLSTRLWRPIAELSYSAYLLHPIVIVGVYKIWAPKVDFGLQDLMLAIPIILTVTFSCSHLMYRLVENPFRKLGRKMTRLRTQVVFSEISINTPPVDSG